MLAPVSFFHEPGEGRKFLTPHCAPVLNPVLNLYVFTEVWPGVCYTVLRTDSVDVYHTFGR